MNVTWGKSGVEAHSWRQLCGEMSSVTRTTLPCQRNHFTRAKGEIKYGQQPPATLVSANVVKLPIFGAFGPSFAIRSLELLRLFPLAIVPLFECFCTNGRPPLPASEALQKGEGGWAAFLELVLIVIYFPFRQMTPVELIRQSVVGGLRGLLLLRRRSCRTLHN